MGLKASDADTYSRGRLQCAILLNLGNKQYYDVFRALKGKILHTPSPNHLTMLFLTTRRATRYQSFVCIRGRHLRPTIRDERMTRVWNTSFCGKLTHTATSQRSCAPSTVSPRATSSQRKLVQPRSSTTSRIQNTALQRTLLVRTSTVTASPCRPSRSSQPSRTRRRACSISRH
jgi:hypothetical protein